MRIKTFKFQHKLTGSFKKSTVLVTLIEIAVHSREDNQHQAQCQESASISKNKIHMANQAKLVKNMYDPSTPRKHM